MQNALALQVDQKRFTMEYMNGKEVIKRLTANGWVVLRQNGSHVRLGKGAARTTVPVHGTSGIRAGTLANIERQSGLKLK